jgi:thioesterase domain-containing protein
MTDDSTTSLSSPASSEAGDVSPDGNASMTSLSSVESIDEIPSAPLPKAASYLLSGNPQVASKFLFLFPDGSGSATSYAALPRFAADTCVYALKCPFMTNPTAWHSGIATVIKLYLQEIRRRQPTGPYNVGGWSAGGILAYEAACQIQAAGEAVDRLILIDSPCPVRLPQMPIKMFTFLDSVGLLGSGNSRGTPEWLIPHFEATVRNLDEYSPQPFTLGKEPMTTTIWARHGVTSATGGHRPPRQTNDPAVMNWLLDDRIDFGSNGWDELLPESSIRSEVIDGHHFSMTNEHVSHHRPLWMTLTRKGN